MKYCFETERSVLGTLITIGDCNSQEVQKAMLVLTEDCFYKPEARTVFRILARCYEKKTGFSLVTVLDYLANEDLKVYDYVQHSLNEMYFSKNPFPAAQELVKLSHVRKQIAVLQRGLEACIKEPFVDEAANILRSTIGDVGRIGLSKSDQGSSFNTIIDRYLSGYYKANDKIRTNVKCLDDALLGGISNQSLVTICGDSGMGKTFFSVYLMAMINKTIPDKQTLFFSLEMAENKICERLIGISGKKQIDKMSDMELISAVQNASQHEYTIFDESAKDLSQIELICRIKAQEKPLSVIVVDYLSLVDCKGQFERNDLRQSEIAKRLASLSMELNCIVIALSQANRESSKRKSDDRCPYPHDAADSSGSFRSSSLWLGIDRPELHNGDINVKNKFVLKCRKDRYGTPFECVWAFDEGIFREVDQENYFRKPVKDIIANPFDLKNYRN